MGKRRDLKLRRDACRLAAQTIRATEVEADGYTPRLWSLAVFYETYLREGAAATRKAFGPKRPRKLKAVKQPRGSG